MENVIEQKASAFLALIDHPVLLVLFCVMLLFVIGGVAIIVIINKNPNLVNNWLKSKKRVELDNGEIINERRHEKRRKDDREQDTSIIERLDGLTKAVESGNADISELRSEIKNLYLITADQEEYMNIVSQGTLENMLFNESLAIFRRLKAFKRLIALKVNGRIKEKGFKLILHNKETWLDVADLKMELKIVDKDYYERIIREINQRIFEGTIL